MSKLIFEISKEGRKCITLPKSEFPSYEVEKGLERKETPKLPEVSEIDLVRHYTNLSKKAHGVDNGFYPLGSCTMKYNPKLNEKMASLEGFNAIHPLQDTEDTQGALELMYELKKSLCEITGMYDMTLQWELVHMVSGLDLCS